MRSGFVFALFCISLVVYVYTSYVLHCRDRASEKLVLLADLTAACVSHCGPGIAPVIEGVLMDYDVELQSEKGDVVYGGGKSGIEVANYVQRVARHGGQPFAVLAKEVRPVGRLKF